MTKRGVIQTLVAMAYLLASFILSAGRPLTAQGCEYWVAPPPIGDDEQPGSFDRPWASLKHASRSVPDRSCTVWFFPGVYAGGTRLNRRFETPTAFRSMHAYRAIMENNGPALSISGARNIIVEGFEIRHAGPGAEPLLVAIDGSEAGWSEHITLRNNVMHDSYNNDLLKIYNLARFVTIEGNLFYNQGPREEQMDVNSVTDVFIQDNIFLNNYGGSGRPKDHQSKQFIVIKDSNGEEDGLLGSRRVYVRRNIFLNWEGQEDETFIQVGLDGKPYYEAFDVHIENNLLIGNSDDPAGSAFGVRGARDVFFINNSVVGDLPTSEYALRITITQENPRNQHIYLYNNIWADPTGTMGDDGSGGSGEFSNGEPADTEGLVLENNLYWNGGEAIPAGDLVSPMRDDPRRIIANPRVPENQSTLTLPFWDGRGFTSGAASVREEFLRLVREFGTTSVFSPGRDMADPAFTPPEDILGKPRRGRSDLGAYEYPDGLPNESGSCRNQQEF
jgi:hypothetical protein